MSKWEEKYEEYKSGLLDTKISELKLLVDNKTAKQEDYDELKKYGRIKENLSKVENLLEYRDKLEKFLDNVDTEINRRETLKNNDKQIKELDRKIKKLQEEYVKVEQQLKDSNIKEEQKLKLEAKKSELLSNINENNSNFAKKQEELKSYLNTDSELKDKSPKQLNAVALKVSSRISKCNMAAKNLVDGKSWDFIEYRLDNWKEPTKYVSKRKIAKEAREMNKQEVPNIKGIESENTKEKDSVEENVKEMEEQLRRMENPQNEIPKEVNEEKFTDKDIEEISEKIEEDLGEDNKPALTFMDRHPRIAKILNFFRRFRNNESENEKYVREYYDRIEPQETNKDEKPAINEKPKEEEKIEEKVEEKISEKDLGLDKDFRTQMRELAEKGMEGLSEEEKAERRKAAEEKLAKFRAENRAREAKKFGQEYADRSDFRQTNNEDNEMQK